MIEATQSHRLQNLIEKFESLKCALAHKDKLSLCIFVLIHCCALFCAGIIIFIVAYILINGVSYLTPSLFAWEYNTQNVSMLPALLNTLSMICLALLLATPIAIFGAIFLEFYAHSRSVFVRLIIVASETLTGIPSIVYGLFGYLAFVIYCGLGLSLLSGAFTLAIMVLPIILRNTQEALKSVPQTYKEASLGLGATLARTIFIVILPCAMSGIVAGIILSIGRIVGESAALLYTAGSVAQIAGLSDSARTLSVHMYALLSEGQYMEQSYATAVVLLFLVIFINALSHIFAYFLNPYKH